MNQQEFEECVELIKSKELELSSGIKRRMDVRLFVCCQAHQANNFPKKEPSLF